MKKKLLVVVLAMTLLMTGCENNQEASSEEVNMGNTMTQIEGENCLYYRNDTKVIYIVMAQRDGNGQTNKSYGYMAPYISKNGLFCVYVNGKIEEIK